MGADHEAYILACAFANVYFIDKLSPLRRELIKRTSVTRKQWHPFIERIVTIRDSSFELTSQEMRILYTAFDLVHKGLSTDEDYKATAITAFTTEQTDGEVMAAKAINNIAKILQMFKEHFGDIINSWKQID